MRAFWGGVRANSYFWFKSWFGGGYEGKSSLSVIGAHKGKEVSGGFELGFFMLGLPMNEETIGEPGEHAFDPHGVGITDTREIIKVRDVESLVESVLNTPVLTIPLKPLLG